MSDAADLSVDTLAQRCAQETESYSRREPSDTQYCYELLRRAFSHADPDALAQVYRIYEPRVLGWVYSHGDYPRTGEDAEYFTSWAIHNCCTALRGEKFERFPSVAHIMAYLKMCVHSAIKHHLRDQYRARTVPLDTAAEPATEDSPDEAINAAELWAHISSMLPDPSDRLLARCFVVEDLKPRQIVVAYPGVWRGVREVSVAIYRIRSLLRNDPELRRRAGEPFDGIARARG